jgi:release factor glutamine methyltransferase
MTLRELRKTFADELTNVYPDKRERNNVICLLFAHLYQTNLGGLLMLNDEEVPGEIHKTAVKLLAQLKNNTPVQYVIGQTWFHGLQITVNPSVLIPRPETEELADKVIQSGIPKNGRLLEIGTGSGCLVLSLKSMRKDLQVIATDISSASLKTAAHNAHLNNLDIRLIEWDIHETHSLENEKFDCIVSNPPYIPPSEKHLLELRVKHHEPAESLFTPDNDPLHFYRIIQTKSKKMLTPAGKLVFECHTDFTTQVASMLKQNHWTNVSEQTDINGKKRFVFATLQ